MRTSHELFSTLSLRSSAFIIKVEQILNDADTGKCQVHEVVLADDPNPIALAQSMLSELLNGMAPNRSINLTRWSRTVILTKPPSLTLKIKGCLGTQTFNFASLSQGIEIFDAVTTVFILSNTTIH